MRRLVHDQALGPGMAEGANKDRSRAQMDAKAAAQRSSQPVIERDGSRVCPGTFRDLGLQAQDPGLGKLQLKILKECIPSHGDSVGAHARTVN